jgi:outer membrane protein TolC
MKSLVLGLSLLLASSLSHAALNCSKSESDLVASTQKAFSAGAVNTRDLFAAELNFLQAELACGETSKLSYCGAALPLAKQAAEMAAGQYSSGSIALDSVISAQRDLRNIKASCQ